MFIKTAIVTLLLAIVALCLFGQVLNFQSGIFYEFQAALLSADWMLLACLAVWCGTFLFPTFSRNDWSLIGLLLFAIAAFFIGYAATSWMPDAIILLAGVTLGRGARFALGEDGEWKIEDGMTNLEIVNRKSVIVNVLVGFVLLLAFSAWWHLEVAHNFYPGTRWTGLWNNPNIYGMLMGVGVVLAIGLLATKERREHKENSNSSFCSILRSLRSFAAVKSAILLVAAGMMAVGLLFSYSRGAWVGTAVGLLYLAWAYGKLKWRWVGIGVGCVALGAGLLWGRTADNGPWYLKRLDFSRPSAQHRVSAWCGALQIIRDHPLGVGWNQAVSTYDKNYSPPEGGAAALTMNSYLMLGTELGLPGLLCFVAYVGLQMKSGKRKAEGEKLFCPAQLSSGLRPPSPVSTGEGHPSGSGEGIRPMSLVICHSSLQVACRAGAVVLLVAFWFDGGLFDLPTAAVFWILLELGTETQMRPALLRSKAVAPTLPAKA